MQKGFEGLMMSNVWNGLRIKKEKNIKNMPLHVLRVDGGSEKVVFQDVEEFDFPNEYTLVGTCTINNREHTFEYIAKFGRQNSTIIGFLPVDERKLS
ncbi:hypothetical protein COK00_12065 [Bacillus cereus]|mgnify:CR=1 FL=1|uniref:hypothetical protein n=1 Tax=Bacillus cereus group TaxID=86661 RepID=UPI000BF6982E|nr:MULTISPECIES: hypothetical protein [Bacillus cereus group]MBJ8109131.1 hypothetical protein [Bacillus cereus group sp. N6]PFB64486.1 hypothetical protein CN291_17570 [Bacillus cereus]PFP65327.1 hypothetical protein COK00_12065 [Bacillus cereus]PGT10114.1 hypothetical protein COD03_20295 [Bacillus cereus]